MNTSTLAAMAVPPPSLARLAGQAGIAPLAVSPAYWRTLGHRLAARLPPPAATAALHADRQTGRGRP